LEKQHSNMALSGVLIANGGALQVQENQHTVSSAGQGGLRTSLGVPRALFAMLGELRVITAKQSARCAKPENFRIQQRHWIVVNVFLAHTKAKWGRLVASHVLLENSPTVNNQQSAPAVGWAGIRKPAEWQVV
jgi:hypothetical protein